MSTRRKPPMTLARPVVKQSAKVATKPRIDESKAAVSVTTSLPSTTRAEPETVEISSDSSSSYEELSEDDEEEVDGQVGSAPENATSQPRQLSSASRPPKGDSARTQGQRDADPDTEMTSPRQNGGPDADRAASPSVSDDEATSPTFGDLLRGSGEGATIVVPSDLNGLAQPSLSQSLTAQQHGLDSAAAALAPSTAVPAPPTLSSLGTVLNQALRTDDADLLESCLHTTDLPTVRATIQRMDSALAATLLSKLAARLHRRPGRAHSLMAWVQWTLVAHGGALAAQPDLVRRLADLGRVLEDRARALPSLLVLKGKLDMLDAQMQLRRETLAGRRRGGRRGAGAQRRHGRPDDEDEGNDDDDEDEDEEDEEDEGVVYVEGDDDDTGKQPNGGVSRSRAAADDDEAVLANGIGGQTDDEEDSDDESADGMEVDDEVASQSSLDESEVDFDDLEDSGDEEDETDADVAAPPAKVQKRASAAKKSSK